MKKNLTFICGAILILWVGIGKNVYGQITYDNYISKPSIVTGALLTVNDPDTSGSADFQFIRRNPYVSLVYTMQAMTDVSAYTPWSYELQLKIMNGADTTEYFLDTLAIRRNDSLPTFQALNYYTLSWSGLYIRVTSVCGMAGIDSTCTANPHTYPLIPEDINLEAGILRNEIKGFPAFEYAVADSGIFFPDTVMTQCRDRYELQLTQLKNSYRQLVVERLETYLEPLDLNTLEMRAIDSTIKAVQKARLEFMIDSTTQCDTAYLSLCSLEADAVTMRGITSQIFDEVFRIPYRSHLNVNAREYYDSLRTYAMARSLDSSALLFLIAGAYSDRLQPLEAITGVISLADCLEDAYTEADHWGTIVPRLAHRFLQIRDSVTLSRGINDSIYLSYIGAYQSILAQTDAEMGVAINELNQQTYVLCGYSGSYYVGCQEFYADALHDNEEILLTIRDSLKYDLHLEYHVPLGLFSTSHSALLSGLLGDVYTRYKSAWDSLNFSLLVNCPSYPGQGEQIMQTLSVQTDIFFNNAASNFLSHKSAVLDNIYLNTGLPDSTGWLSVRDSLILAYQSHGSGWVNEKQNAIAKFWPDMSECFSTLDSLYTAEHEILLFDYLTEMFAVLDTAGIFLPGSYYAYEMAMTRYRNDLLDDPGYIFHQAKSDSINNEKDLYCDATFMDDIPEKSTMACLIAYENEVRKLLHTRESYINSLDSITQAFRGIAPTGGWNDNNGNIIYLLEDLVEMYGYHFDTLAVNRLGHCVSDSVTYNQILDHIETHSAGDSLYFEYIFRPMFNEFCTQNDSLFTNFPYIYQGLKNLYVDYFMTRIFVDYQYVFALLDSAEQACFAASLASSHFDSLAYDFFDDFDLFLHAAAYGITTDTIGYRESAVAYSVLKNYLYFSFQNAIAGLYDEADTACHFRRDIPIPNFPGYEEGIFDPVPTSLEIAICEGWFSDKLVETENRTMANISTILGNIFATDTTDTLNTQYVFENWIALLSSEGEHFNTADSIWFACTGNSAFVDAVFSEGIGEGIGLETMSNGQGPHYVYHPELIYSDPVAKTPNYDHLPYFEAEDSVYFQNMALNRIALFKMRISEHAPTYNLTDSCILYGPDSLAMASYMAVSTFERQRWQNRLDYIKSQFDSTAIHPDTLEMKLRWAKAAASYEFAQFMISTLSNFAQVKDCMSPELYPIESPQIPEPQPKADIRLHAADLMAGDFGVTVPLNEVISTISPQMEIVSEENGSCPDKIFIEWEPINGALEYDLEWVYIDDMIYVGGVEANTLPDIQYKAFSLAEPTRVTVTENRFPFPGEYPDGKLYFRVRGVARIIDNTYGSFDQPQFMPWGYNWMGYEVETADVNFNAENPFNSTFENNLNWQWETSYAEEGKFKRVIGYYDGLNRARQVVTHLSSDNLSVIGETLYDHEGRPAVQVLPYPEPCYELSYRDQTRSDMDDGAFDKKDFELTDGDKRMNTSFGASRYYSAGNPFMAVENPLMHSGAVPDAENYPYTQVSFLPDNTGRPRASGGVGATHALYATPNRATKYFYANASETELTRLFGKNVGVASHYKKNAVLDANGQLSVAYTDQEGRTIATALAGRSPDNVLPLESLQEEPFTQNLSGNNLYDPINREWGIRYVHLNEVPSNEYEFTYDYGMDHVINPTEEGMPQPCIICEFDLEITVTGPDGLPLPITQIVVNGNSVPGTPTIFRQRIDNSRAYELEDSCDSHGISKQITFKVAMDEVGAYTISKKLRWDKEAALATLQAAMQPEVNTHTAEVLEHLIEIYEEAIDPGQCDLVPGTGFGAIPDDDDDGLLTKLTDAECRSKLMAMIEQIEPWQSGGTPPAGAAHYYPASSGDGAAFWGNVTDLIQDGFDHPNDPLYIVPAVIAAYVVEGDAAATRANIYADYANWTPEVKAELAKAHPEYCWYKKCLGYATGVGHDIRMAPVENLTAGQPYRKQQDDISSGMTQTAWAPFAGSGTTILDPVQDAQITIRATEHAGPDHDATIWQMALEVEDGFVPSPNAPFTQTASMAAWQTFRGGYQNAKHEAFYVETSGCSLSVAGHAVFKKPDIPDNGTEMEDENNDNAAYFAQNGVICQDVCLANVESWLTQLFGNCATWPTINHDIVNGSYTEEYDADILYIRNNLLQHCINTCGTQNPMGVITEDILTDAMESGSGYLYQAIYRFNSVFGGTNGCGAVYEDNDVWYSTIALNTNQFEEVCAQVPGFWYGRKAKVMNAVAQLSSALANYSLGTNSFGPISIPASNGFTSMDVLNGGLYAFNGIIDDTDCEHITNQAALLACLLEEELLTYSAISYIEDDGVQCRGNTIEFYDSYDFPIESVKVRGIAADEDDIHFDVSGDLIVGAEFVVAPIMAVNDGGGAAHLEYGTPTVVSGYIKIEVYESCVAPICSIYPTGWDSTLTVADWNEGCMEGLLEQAHQAAQQDFSLWLDDYVNRLWADARCAINEDLYVTYDKAEYHYTLYYYDQAHNLVQTVPPKGVHPVDGAYFDAAGRWDQIHNPQHDMESRYKFNSLEVAIESETPDGGLTLYRPDLLGRPEESVNAEQHRRAQEAATDPGSPDYGKYVRIGSKTHYDRLGRIDSVFEQKVVKAGTVAPDEYPQPGQAGVGTTVSQITATTYDQPISVPLGQGWIAQNTRNRVTAVRYYETKPGLLRHANYYGYDIHGNVKSMVTDVPALTDFGRRYHRTDYYYDLVSGKVNEVHYQPEGLDRFFYRYTYDADNRLVTAESSRDYVSWERDAKYFYYPHGPLKRVETGHRKVQGSDCFYTIHGWLKGVNSGALDRSHDVGRDGDGDLGGNPNALIARDAYGFTLDYHDGDYSPVGTAGMNHIPAVAGSDFGAAVLEQGLYNGNIARMSTALLGVDETRMDVLGNAYRYDQLNRIRSNRSFISGSLHGGNGWAGITGDDRYRGDYTYDANGNILTLGRYDGSGTLTDDFTAYNYTAQSAPGGGDTYNYVGPQNRLGYIDDAVTALGMADQGAGNYGYDEIGNLTSDEAEEIEEIKWTVYGKVRNVIRESGSTKPDLDFYYTASGQRYLKVVRPKDGNGDPLPPTQWRFTYYQHDAQGNILAIYEIVDRAGECGYEMYLSQHVLYGSSRLGVANYGHRVKLGEIGHGFPYYNTPALMICLDDMEEPDDIIAGVAPVGTYPGIFTQSPGGRKEWLKPVDMGAMSPSIAVLGVHNYSNPSVVPQKVPVGFVPGRKQYEFGNHLGNVLVTISDMPIGMDEDSDGTVDYYMPNVLTVSDYEPFGGPLADRTETDNNARYAYGMNGQLKDNEIAGEGNSYTAEYWQYDPRIGRRWNIDPVVKEWESPYAAFGNSPLLMGDPNGDDPQPPGGGANGGGGSRTFNQRMGGQRNTGTYNRNTPGYRGPNVVTQQDVQLRTRTNLPASPPAHAPLIEYEKSPHSLNPIKVKPNNLLGYTLTALTRAVGRTDAFQKLKAQIEKGQPLDIGIHYTYVKSTLHSGETKTITQKTFYGSDKELLDQLQNDYNMAVERKIAELAGITDLTGMGTTFEKFKAEQDILYNFYKSKAIKELGPSPYEIAENALKEMAKSGAGEIETRGTQTKYPIIY